MSNFNKVGIFMKTFGQEVKNKPSFGSDKINKLRLDLIKEELEELNQAINDKDLVKILVEKEIVLEICPGSNVFLGVYPDLLSYPVNNLLDLGVKLTISTDDPPFFQTSMNIEYEALAATFSWNDKVFKELNKVALNAAFCDSATKYKIAKKCDF